jgi:DNA polymerase-1
MKKNLIIFDINSHFHRAYRMCLANGHNEREGAFFNGKPNYMIKPVLEMIDGEIARLKKKFDYVVCVVDPKGKNFRHDLYPKYKKNRSPDDQEFTYQRECLLKILSLKGYYIIREEGVEADDVIGTIATKANEIDFLDIYISTRDKDMFILINEKTYVYDGKERVLYDEQGCLNKKGVRPYQIKDYLTMDGDKADNIIGIPKLGKKTIPKILEKFTLEEILKDPDILQDKDIKIQGKQKTITYIKENKDFILLMNKLVELKTDLDLGVSLKNFVKKYEDKEALTNAYRKMGIK